MSRESSEQRCGVGSVAVVLQHESVERAGEARGEVLSMSRAQDIGTTIARKVFQKRGNHSEAHLGETELAALLQVAAEHAVAGLRALRSDIAENTSKSCYCDRPPEGESGTIECRECAHRRWITTLEQVIG